MIILIDKPSGITSFDVIRRLKEKTKINKIGHSGTLDPLASGLMILATDKDTKNLSSFLKLPKTYEVVIRVGEKRTTGDLDGEIEEKIPVLNIDDRDLESNIKSLLGEHNLPVPIYSAIKVKGRRLYDYARKKEKVDIPIKKMNVYSVLYKGFSLKKDFALIYALFEVSSGTYIRSLVEECGKRISYPTTVEKLRRIKIGDFKIKDAEKI